MAHARAVSALKSLFALLLRLKPEAVADSFQQSLRIVDAVDARVADGRRYLWGDRLTLSDISFATALAPFLLPSGYSAPIPDLHRQCRRRCRRSSPPSGNVRRPNW